MVWTPSGGKSHCESCASCYNLILELLAYFSMIVRKVHYSGLTRCKQFLRFHVTLTHLFSAEVISPAKLHYFHYISQICEKTDRDNFNEQLLEKWVCDF